MSTTRVLTAFCASVLCALISSNVPARAGSTAAPHGVVADVREGAIVVSWSPPADAASPVRGYVVQRDGFRVGRVRAPRTRWVDATADPAVAHTYRLRARTADRTRSPWSVPAVSSGRPTTPGDLQVAIDDDTVVVRWLPSSDPGGRVRFHVIERDGVRVARVRAPAGVFVDDAVDLTVPHRYRVRARDDDRQRSPWSVAVVVPARPVDPPPLPPPPAGAVAPSALRVSATGDSATLTWAAASFPDSYVRTYEIERDGRWVGWVWGAERTWTDTGVDRAVGHSYRVYATDATRAPGPRSASAWLAPDVAPAPAALVAVGDIARCGGEHPGVAALLENRPGAVFAALGDIAYPDGSARNFADCYDPFFGPYRDRTRPTVGNHEYVTPGASGYFDYFGWRAGARDRGYYSYDLGAWHVVVLNSECWEVGGCGAGDAQYRWLQGDLAANDARCLLAYWHRPVLTTEQNGVVASHMVRYFDLLQAEGADVVLGGHHHVYERWGRTDSAGRRTADGIRSFVVGTGGASLRGFGPTHAGLDARTSSFGALALTLRSDGYDWQFLHTGGPAFVDAGSDSC